MNDDICQKTSPNYMHAFEWIGEIETKPNPVAAGQALVFGSLRCRRCGADANWDRSVSTDRVQSTIAEARAARPMKKV